MRKRIFAILVLTLALAGFSALSAQTKGVTVSLKDKPLKLFIRSIERQTDYKFFYEEHAVDVNRTISVFVNDATIRQAMDAALSGTGIAYEISDRRIMLMPAQKGKVLRQTETKKISGKVLDETGQPVIGAGVFVKGTTIGTTTDADGNYNLEVPPGAVLQISCIGFQPRDISTGSQETGRIVLQEGMNTLDESIVVGYGTQKKANLTGAVDQVGEEAFEGRPNANLAQMLQGRVANLNLKFTDGRPNSSPSFNIRGRTSIGQGGSALVLIDGVEGNASLLNPNDIESVSVLKDAASSAIYGSRAPYGVVLITTKNAKKGTATVNYQSNFSFERPTAVPDVVSDGYVWAEHFYKSWYNYKGSNPTAINKTMEFSTAWLEEYRLRHESGNFETLVSDGSIGTAGRWLYYHKGTDYYDALYKDFTFSQTHNLSISGADDKFDYYVSARLYDNDGLFDSAVNPDSYKMYNGRVKVGYQVTDWLKIMSNTDIAYSKYVMPETQSEGNGNIWRNIADEGHPCSPIINPDGSISYSGVYSVGNILYGGSNRT